MLQIEKIGFLFHYYQFFFVFLCVSQRLLCVPQRLKFALLDSYFKTFYRRELQRRKLTMSIQNLCEIHFYIFVVLVSLCISQRLLCASLRFKFFRYYPSAHHLFGATSLSFGRSFVSSLGISNLLCSVISATVGSTVKASWQPVFFNISNVS